MKFLKHILPLLILLITYHADSAINNISAYESKISYEFDSNFSEPRKNISCFDFSFSEENHNLDIGFSDTDIFSRQIRFGINTELIEAWKIVKKAGIDDLARNTDVLDEVLKLQSKTLNSKPLDVQKLFDNGFGNTLNKHSDADKTKMLARINGWDAKYVDDLARRLGNEKYNGLADELADPVLFKLYDDIIKDPGNAIDIAKHGGDDIMVKVGRSEFFQKMTGLGRKFETKVCLKAFKNRSSAKYIDLKEKFHKSFKKNLDDYDMFSQVQLKYDRDNYFVADQVFVKYGIDEDGIEIIDDILIVENKLKNSTKLTKPQMSAYKKTIFNVRSNNVLSEFDNGKRLSSGRMLKFSSNKQWFKVCDGKNGDAITIIRKINKNDL